MLKFSFCVISILKFYFQIRLAIFQFTYHLNKKDIMAIQETFCHYFI